MTDEQHYNGYVIDESYEVFGEITDVPLGNIVAFIEHHESEEFPSSAEPAGYRINRVELDE